MNRYTKLNLLLILILGLGLIYLGSQVSDLSKRVNELDETVIETQVRISNGTDIYVERTHLTKGATALEALRRVASVETESYPGMGEMIVSIDGVRSNQSTGEYWIFASRESGSGNWTGVSKSVDSFYLGDNTELFFWYGVMTEAPFEAF